MPSPRCSQMLLAETRMIASLTLETLPPLWDVHFLDHE
jgi:hypothetical protein